MASPDTAHTVTIVPLDDDSLWVTFQLAGQQFEVECWDAYERLREIEAAALETDEHRCKACDKRFRWPRDQWGKEMICPGCGSDDVDANQSQWDTIAAHMRQHYGLTRCSRTEARAFYAAVLETTGVAKKKSEPEPESPTGTDSTPAAGATGEPSGG